ncbi:MAG: CRTAC1 family protein [Verrucomicrobia bacterium]|nr:CRTAC1 family protein [Verrucomicrobiota bacterium]
MTLAADQSSQAAPKLEPGTTAMVRELSRIQYTTDPRSMAYLNDRLVTELQQRVLGMTNLHEQARVRYFLGVQLLNAGNSEEAFQEFQSVEAQIAQSGAKLSVESQAELRLRKALTLLRLGEQENCLLNHRPESCLFPLETGGFHRLPRGSRGAIKLFTEHLEQSPNDLSGRWLLNLAYMTLGQWPDQVPERWRIPASAFASEYPLPRFPDVAGAVGLDVDDLAGGCIIDDFNNDGRLDVVASSWGPNGQLRYFRNEGGGRFVEQTEAAGLIGLVGGLNIQQTDYNNDGWLDIWVLRGAWLGGAGRIPNSLLKNRGDGTFVDVTVASGLLSRHPTQTSVWFDYDGDGWLDLFVGNESGNPRDPDPSELFHNQRDGTFVECAATSGIAIRRFVKGVASADFNRDGRPDLFLSCLDGPNLLLRNDGGTEGAWKFSDISRAAGVGDRVISFPTWFFDYDNDGWEDLFVSGYAIRNVGDVAADYLGQPHQAALPKLYRNQQDGTFADVTVASRLNRVCLTMGSNFGDLDNDGWLDFYLGTGNPDLSTLVPNRMFRNAEGRFFQEVTTAGGFGHLQKGHGVAFADLDEDGDQDVYIVMGGAFSGDRYRNSLFLNPGSTNHWLKLKLEGTRSNRAALGARIHVTVATPQGTRSIFKTVNSGGSFGSSPLQQEIGLGQASTIDSVQITWPGSGNQQQFRGLLRDRTYLLRENEAQARELHRPVSPFDLTRSHPHVAPARP